MRKLILTCEHGGNEIPEPFSALFLPHHEALATHRGWDIGALELAKHLSEDLEAPLFYSTTSRLLVELNRSVHHPAVFSELTKSLNKKEKKALLESYYHPYRNQVEDYIAAEIEQGLEIIHIGIHSFTPILNGQIRNCDIGLLYDPRRIPEKVFCKVWKKEINNINPSLLVRYNYPYKGSADGFTTFLRRRFEDHYAGIELEVKNNIFEEEVNIYDNLLQSLKAALHKFE